MNEQANERRVIPRPGEFCDRHFSWMCQAGQGKCSESSPAVAPTWEALADPRWARDSEQLGQWMGYPSRHGR